MLNYHLYDFDNITFVFHGGVFYHYLNELVKIEFSSQLLEEKLCYKLYFIGHELHGEFTKTDMLLDVQTKISLIESIISSVDITIILSID